MLHVDGNEQLLGFLELLAGLVDPSKLQLTELGGAWPPSEGDEVAACLAAAMERIFVYIRLVVLRPGHFNHLLLFLLLLALVDEPRERDLVDELAALIVGVTGYPVLDVA